MAKVLGLDLGTNSIGWAITEQNEDGYTLLDKGVDIFQEGVAREKGDEKPMVQTRTDSRALRRHYYRRRLRKIELLKVLVEHDMCPHLSKEELDDWRYNKRYPMNEDFLRWQRTDDNKDKNPYHGRHIALHQELDMSSQIDRHLLGRALYHLAQRRGFLSNRKDQSDSKEDGAVKGGIQSLNEAMEVNDCEYIGDYFYLLYNSGENIRKHYTSRKEHYLKEFYAICERQHIPAELQKSLYRAIFFQRPLKSQKGLVGGCTFEKGKARCPISHPRFEEYRMWAFINNIKVKTPSDTSLRPLNGEELEKILPLFFRKSKPHFDFEDIAKAIAGKRKGDYAYEEEKAEASYRFNFPMGISVSSCPVAAQLRAILGEEWEDAVCELYQKGDGKTKEQIVNDIWHVLFSFDNDDCLRGWAQTNLQLNDEQAEQFVKINIPQGYASLSLCAINKILPYLRRGFRYDEAAFLANLSQVVPTEVWSDDDKRNRIENFVADAVANYTRTKAGDTKENAIYGALLDCGLYGDELDMEKLYHPSMIETYPEVKPNERGLRLLGSPRTTSVRNPMAMRALFRLRALVNHLLKDGKIDSKTKINIEFARGLNNANKRKAIEQYQRDIEKKHKEYADNIKKLYKEQCGCDIEPTETDILKYQLWEEQDHHCLYTGDNIGICDFLGANPKYDIEHTVPRSRGGDNSQMNKTLCQNQFNRDIKGGKFPAELPNHASVMARIEELGWEKKIAELEKQIQAKMRASKGATTKDAKDNAIKSRHLLTMELDYWRGKLSRFKMTEVPEGFSNRQGVDIGIIGRYARLYLKSAFDRVYVVKGSTTSDFRKMWGLQDEDTKKERANHIHHCIDAITIACIGRKEYDEWARYQRQEEYYRRGKSEKPQMPKPWQTFTEDVKAIAEELLVSHHTANNLPKHSKKAVRVRGRIQRNEAGEIIYAQGDTARASLHMQTFYGAIMRDDEVKYVVRKALGALQPTDVEKIVDDAVRECVKAAIAEKGFKEAMAEPILFNPAKGVYIKKVRIFTPSVTSPIHLKKHRDQSRHEHKQSYYVANEGNYCMAIYEGEVKGKMKRGFEIVNNLEAAHFYNGKSDYGTLVPQQKDGLDLKYILRTGTMVLFYETSPEEFNECTKADLVKRLYKIIKMSKDGRVTFKFHQEAQNDEGLKQNYEKLFGEKAPKALTDGFSSVNFDKPYPKLLISNKNMNIIVEGYDFDLTVAGEIKFKHKF